MVICVMTHFLKVIVLTANAKTLLGVRAATWLGLTGTEDYIFPLVHTSVGEHQRRVILDNHRG